MSFLDEVIKENYNYLRWGYEDALKSYGKENLASGWLNYIVSEKMPLREKIIKLIKKGNAEDFIKMVNTRVEKNTPLLHKNSKIEVHPKLLEFCERWIRGEDEFKFSIRPYSRFITSTYIDKTSYKYKIIEKRFMDILIGALHTKLRRSEFSPEKKPEIKKYFAYHLAKQLKYLIFNESFR